MFKSKSISISTFVVLLACSCGLVANSPTPSNLYVEKSAIQTEAGEINFNLFNSLDHRSAVTQKIVGICDEHDIVVLDNGSKWQVSKPEILKGWGSTDRLVITHNHAMFSLYKFALVNVELGLAVPISMVAPPLPNSDKVLYIKFIDESQNAIYLNNGIKFIVNSRDHGSLSKFHENNQVLIGMNTHDADLDYPFLMLDASFNSTSYVRCNLIN